MIRAALFAGALAAVTAAFGGSASAPCPCESSALADTQPTITIEIPEVECAGCSLEIRKAVKAVGGVVRIAEGQPKNRIVVTYEAATGRPDGYVEAVKKAGFPKAHEVARS